MTDEPEPPSPEDAPAPTVPQPIRSRPAKRAAAGEPAVDAGNDPMGHIIAYLNSLRAGGAAPAEELSPDAPSKASAPLREKRLQRSAAGEQGMTEFVPRRTREEIAAEVPRGGGAKPSSLNPPRSQKRGSLLPYVLVFGAGLLVAGAIRWWPASRPTPGRTGAAGGAQSGQTAAVRSPGEPVSAEAVTTTNRVLEAIQAGKVAEAASLLDAARQRQVALPGMSYQGALLAAAQSDILKADRLMDESIALNEDVSACLYLRANIVAKTDYKAAIQFMEAAAHAEPFNPRYYFFWGECLRRIGSPTQALVQLQEALKRRPTVVDADLIRFKIHLAMIEAADPDFPKQLAAQLARPNVSGETLLLAAASEISQGNYVAAKPYLQRAGQSLPPYVLWSRLRDYFFRAQGDQPDLAPLWATLSSADLASPIPPGGVKAFVDPATLGLAEADPAIW